MRTPCVPEFLRKTTGSITIEFVLMVPVLLAGLAFAYEFGRALWAYDIMTRDVRAAVRYVSRVFPYDNTSKSNAVNVAKTGVTSGGATHFPWGTPWSACDTGKQPACVAVATVANSSFKMNDFNENGTIVSVTGTVPMNFSLLSFLQPFGVNTTYTITVTDQARYIGN